jgi:hypothetical protein
MWLLVIVHFAGAMQIDKMDILEIHWNEKRCIERVNKATQAGIPVDTNIGCLYLKGVDRA